jgi:peptide/nickel transport system ATP-binding protein
MELSHILDVSGLTVLSTAADAVPILQDISFGLRSAEIFGIYGESGAGKTVLSRALANWLPESLSYGGGAIAFCNRNILSPDQRSTFRVGRDIAYIGSKPQSALDPTQPVGSQITEKLHSVRPEWSLRDCRDRVVKLLAEVRIPSPKERYWDYPSKFSGGMMQRAMIVDAICAEPALLVADNITQPLDVTIAAQIVALLHDLCLRHKTATIYLSSSLATLGQFGSRTAILHHGRLIEQQDFRDLMRAPISDYTKQAIASVPRIWSAADGPAPRRKTSQDTPLMRIENVHRTYKARKRGTFNTYSLIQAVRGVTLDITAEIEIALVLAHRRDHRMVPKRLQRAPFRRHLDHAAGIEIRIQPLVGRQPPGHAAPSWLKSA